MWLQATLTTADLALALHHFCPARIQLDEERWLSIARPHSVKLLPDLGARFVTEAKLRWSVLGIDVPVTVKEAEIFLIPRIAIEEGGTRQCLCFDFRIGELDLKYVPHLLDVGIASKINDALKEANISWDFSKTLDFHFAMPKQVSPIDSVHLQAHGADLKVSDVALTIATSLTLEVSRTRPVSAD
ncbi:MAG: hypothetical protein Q8Q09_08535 [Deltaproteobacteria bacterium]|nr:hypothetical protein [Deltaproteobacteria bacterium]